MEVRERIEKLEEMKKTAEENEIEKERVHGDWKEKEKRNKRQ